MKKWLPWTIISKPLPLISISFPRFYPGTSTMLPTILVLHEHLFIWAKEYAMIVERKKKVMMQKGMEPPDIISNSVNLPPEGGFDLWMLKLTLSNFDSCAVKTRFSTWSFQVTPRTLLFDFPSQPIKDYRVLILWLTMRFTMGYPRALPLIKLSSRLRFMSEFTYSSHPKNFFSWDQASPKTWPNALLWLGWRWCSIH